jgi:hypothetical protein
MSQPEGGASGRAGGPLAGGRIKGTAIVHVVRALRIQRDRIRATLPPHLHSYLDEKVRLAGWYPEEDGFDLLRIFATVAPPRDDLWEWLGSQTAARDLVEIYDSMVRRGDPRGTLEQLDALWRLYHDTGRMAVVQEPGGAVRIELYDFLYGGEDFARLMRGYLAEALRLAGAANPEVTVLHLGDAERPWRWRARWT